MPATGVVIAASIFIASIVATLWPASTRWLPAYEIAKLHLRARAYKTAVRWFEDALRQARTLEAAREIRSFLAYTHAEAAEARPAEAPAPDPLAP